MGHFEVKAPGALLLDPSLSTSAKLIWMAARTESVPLSHAQLVTKTDLTLPTVIKSVAALAKAGWFSDGPIGRAVPISPISGGAVALVPTTLLMDHRLKPLSRVLYASLQMTPGFRKLAGQFSYASLGALTGMARYTAQIGVNNLVHNGWLEIAQANQKAPVVFTLIAPAVVPGKIALATAKERLHGVKFGGEALMREYLSLLVDESVTCEDNATPTYLINPYTGEPLQLDRSYSSGVAFEFNGAQHYTVTEFSTSEELRKQQARDSMKEGFCRRMGITLVIVHEEDLSLAGMQRKVGNLLPLRNLQGYQGAVRFLDGRGEQYRRAAERGRRRRRAKSG